jgi:signal transduction histidine kinase/DNA-binding response OmpR family regulator
MSAVLVGHAGTGAIILALVVSPLPADLEVAAGLGGEMGKRFAAMDWESHPLGPPAKWAPEIRSTVAMALASRFPTVLWIGPDLRVIYNDAYIPMVFDRHPEAFGSKGSEVWADIWDVIGPMLAGVASTGEATWSDDLSLTFERGTTATERFFTFTYSPILAADGQVTAIFCAVSETTERVLGERRLQFLNSLAAAVLDSDTESEMLGAAMALFATGSPDLPFAAVYLKDPASDRFLFETATRPVDRILPACAPTGQSWGAVTPGVEALIVDDLPARMPMLATQLGSAGPAQALVLPLADAAQTAIGLLVLGLSPHRPLDDQYRGFCRLVSDQIAGGLLSARAYEAERRRAEALAELDAAKTTFFTNISHELRTPLTLLLGPASDALADVEHPLDPEQRHRIEMVARNGERLLSLVNTLLEFSRIEAGTIAGRFVPIDLAEETAKLATMFGSAVEQAGLEFKMDADPIAEPVYVDREMWAKIVLNLLSNALKFTFEGSIEVALKTSDGWAELSVRDTGEGVPPTEQERLFERFYRVTGTRSRSFEGSGIGLALVAELAQLHGGSVGVESVPGEGSRFWVRLPFGREHLPKEQIAPGPETEAAGVASAGALMAETLSWLSSQPTERPEPDWTGADGEEERPLILVVDDNADMRDYLVRLLSTRYRVQAAADGLEGLAKARDETPDLVLTDVMMPRINGFELLAALRAHPKTTGIPVVFLTARAGADGAVEGLDAGADDYLVKPFVAAELMARVRANLEFDRSRRTREALERNTELLDQAQRLSHLGSWELDLPTMRMIASDEMLRLLDVDVATFATFSLAEGIGQLVHPEDQARVADAFDGAARGGGSFALDVRFRRRDGREWLARLIGEVVTDPDGQPVKVRGSLQDVDEQRRVERRVAETAAERDIADRLQAALLPDSEVEADGLDVATFYRAGAEHTLVGGDWYDVIDLGASVTALVVGDVMGRGVQAAALMGQIRSALRAFAKVGLGPAEILECLDPLVRDLDPEQIVTCLVATYDQARSTLTWANAGHLPPVLVQAASPPTILEGSGPPLGTGPFGLEEQQIEMTPGSLIALYTDGLVERRGGDIDSMISDLAQQLAVRRTGHLDSTVQSISESLLDETPDDDVALLLARVRQEESTTRTASWGIQYDEKAVGQARHRGLDVLNEWEVPAAVRDDAVLAISELTTNALIHGALPVEITLRHTGPELVIEVTDALPAPPRRLRPTPYDEHGRGLQMLSILSARWGTRPAGTGKRVWCSITLPGPGESGSRA